VENTASQSSSFVRSAWLIPLAIISIEHKFGQEFAADFVAIMARKVKFFLKKRTLLTL
jgi:hypothetical protein